MEKSNEAYFVRYDVSGFGSREAGPYGTAEEAERQRADISGFEGVSGAVVVPFPLHPMVG